MSSVTVNVSAMQAGCAVIDDDSYLTTMSCSMMSSYTLPLDARLLSGSTGSIVSAIVSQPFEVAKVKQQNYHHRPLPTTASSSAMGALSSVNNRSFGTLSMLRQVIAKEGVRGVYAGLAPTMVMSIPNYVLYLTAYDELVSRLKGYSTSATAFGVKSPPLGLSLPDHSIPLVGGALARLIATTAVAPLELLRTRDASSSSSSHCRQQPQSLARVWTQLHTIVQLEGVGALYKGILPSLSRDVPFAAIYMLFLERFRDLSRPWLLPTEYNIPGTSTNNDTTISPQQQVRFEFINAALAGMVAASCTAPLDVVKTRLQSSGTPTSLQQPSTTLEVLRSVVRSEGLAGLWRGNSARMMKVAPQYAIMISFYEVGKKVMA